MESSRSGIATDIIDRLKHRAEVASAAAISQGLPLMALRHRVGMGVPSGTAPANEADPIEFGVRFRRTTLGRFAFLFNAAARSPTATGLMLRSSPS